MYVELPDEVCCNTVTAKEHTGISILRAKYYVPMPSTVRLKLNLQPNCYNRFMMEYSVPKISQKNVFSFLCATSLYIIFAVNLIKTTQTVSLQRDNYNVEMCLISSEISVLFSSATTVTTINLI